MDLKFKVKKPNYAKSKTLTQEDVWGRYNMETHTRESKGMIVASSCEGYPDICPVWGDKMLFKSVTVICDIEQQTEVAYWLEFVHGGNSITKSKILDNGKIAFRSDYQCW